MSRGRRRSPRRDRASAARSRPQESSMRPPRPIRSDHWSRPTRPSVPRSGAVPFERSHLGQFLLHPQTRAELDHDHIAAMEAEFKDRERKISGLSICNQEKEVAMNRFKNTVRQHEVELFQLRKIIKDQEAVIIKKQEIIEEQEMATELATTRCIELQGKAAASEYDLFCLRQQMTERDTKICGLEEQLQGARVQNDGLKKRRLEY